MSSDNFLHYASLGLQPGASQKEIRSAYRRLLKLYHPDRDASLDAEVRYKEIRAAYAALLQKPAPQFQTPRSQTGAAGDGRYEPPKREYETQDGRTAYGNYRAYAENAEAESAEAEDGSAPYFDLGMLIRVLLMLMLLFVMLAVCRTAWLIFRIFAMISS